MTTRSARLWQQADFMKLWMGQSISQLGSQVTLVALPLTAVLVLHANAAQMGILGALGMLPFLLVGLFAGVYVDRMRRRPLLILSDLGRFVLMAAVPLLYVSQMAGPGLGGALVQLVSAPVAIAVDAISYAASVFFLMLIRGKEPAPQPSPILGIWAQIGDGLRVVFGNRILWSLAGCTGTSNFFGSVTGTVFVLYLIQQLKVPAAWIGLIFGIGSAGGLIGALLANKLTKRIGFGSTIIGAIGVGNISRLLVPLAPHTVSVALLFLVASEIAGLLCSTVYNINQVSLRQAITPNRLLGRMNASVRFLIWGTMPLGSLAGGWLGEHFGLYMTLWIGSLGGLTSVLWVIFSPVRQLVHPPAPSEDSELAAG